jgi:hypothetical protein
MPNDVPPTSRPRLPRSGGSRLPQQRNATWLALGGLLGAAFGLLLLITLVITGFAPAGVVVVLLILTAVAFFFGGHYLIWGIWLDRILTARGRSQPVDFWKRAPLPTPVDLNDEETAG